VNQEQWVARLTKAQADLEKARAAALTIVEDAILVRNRAIKAAVEDGMSMAEVGRITGISRERIRQIVSNGDPPQPE
jgi:DNA-directed RNA polymerase sigma subunit (sigma70/sigma32)